MSTTAQATSTDKTVYVVANQNTYPVTLNPGMTTRDVLARLGLPAGFWLSGNDGARFGDDEDLYPAVHDGEKLQASPEAGVAHDTAPGAGLVGLLRGLLTNPSPTARTGGGGRILPERRPYWQERRWRQHGADLHGYYRTRHGAYAGRIEDAFSPLPRFYITRAPTALLTGPHRYCFRSVRKDEYAVHFHPTPVDVNTGIRTVEHALVEVLQ
jgi:hypothetical protein